MERISIIALLVLSVITIAPINHWKQKEYRVGILSTTGPDLRTIKGVRDALSDYGYIEGENLLLKISPRSNYDSIRALLELIINPKTANEIRLKIPPEILQRADRIIK